MSFIISEKKKHNKILDGVVHIEDDKTLIACQNEKVNNSFLDIVSHIS